MASVKATVLLDTYRWKDDPDGPIHEATRGETITVSQEELDRGLAMQPPGLAKGENPDDSEFADSPREIPENLDELKTGELKKLAASLGLDVSDLKTDDALKGAIVAAPGYERPQV